MACLDTNRDHPHPGHLHPDPPALEYADVADVSWFARQQPSIGFQARYSFFNTQTKLPVAC